MDDQRAGEHGQHNADAAESCEDRQDRDAQLPLGRGGWREDVVRLQGSSWGGGMVGHGLGVLVTPGDVGTHAADHPGEDAEGDAPIARALGPFMRDVVVQIGIGLLDPTLGDRVGQVSCVEPHPPGDQGSHALRCHAGSAAIRRDRPTVSRAAVCRGTRCSPPGAAVS